MITYKTQEPEPIVLEGLERHNGKIAPKRIFFIKYNDFLGYLYLENGERLNLTPFQLKIVELLIEALKQNIPYLSGKDILYQIGSEQLSVSCLFRRAPNWRKFIQTTPQGFYRLNLYLDATYDSKTYSHTHQEKAL